MGENLLPETVSSIMRQLKDLTQSPAEGIRVRVNEEHVTDILAELDGPTDTPFEGGTFKMKLTLPADYPNNPPKGFFTTKIFHPNIRQPSGEICVNTLKRDRSPSVASPPHVRLLDRGVARLHRCVHVTCQDHGASTLSSTRL